MKDQRGSSYTSTLSLTSALDGVDGQRHAPAALPPRTGTHSTGGCVGPREGLGGREESRSPQGFDPRTVQHVTRRYTD